MRGLEIGRRAAGPIAPLLASLLAAVGHASALSGQASGELSPETRDTLPVVTIETVVVTADRAESTVATSTASVSVLSGELLSHLPTRGLAGALQTLPGFAFLNFDGLGYAPQATVRGFYGGGETDYVLLLLDGRPMNTLETGSLNWNQIPRSSIESIEVIRGGTSSLYGDAAIGGVVNVRTRRHDSSGGLVSLAGGSLGSFSGRAQRRGLIAGRQYTIFGDLESTDGYRAHAERTFGSAGGSVDLVEGDGRSLTLSALGHWRTFDDPGPLQGEALESSRTASSPFYRFDDTEERTFQIGADGSLELRPGADLSVSVAGEHRSLDQVRTLPLSSEFADTKNRELTADNITTTMQATIDSFLLENDRLTLGIDAKIGFLDSRYYAVVTGAADTYEMASGEQGVLDAKGDGRRTSRALFVQYDWRPVEALRLLVGGRYDGIHDTFEPALPEDAERSTADHSAFSPKVGFNVRYAGSDRHVGHLYANVARSFKAPTLDQLYDQRSTPVPFPPFSITTSNPELNPQTGTSLEIGSYHRVQSANGLLAAELTLSAYRMDMKNELDFDLATYRYVNVGRSRHDGIEAGVALDVGGLLSLFGNFTRQDVTIRAGENLGNQLKAIPRDVVSAGITAVHPAGLSGNVTVVRSSGIYLDDANTLPLSDYMTVDARLAWHGSGLVTVFADGFNLLDETYSSTGFPDPAGSGVIFYHPAAGRTARIGVEIYW